MLSVKYVILSGLFDLTLALTIHTLTNFQEEEEHKKHIPILKQDFQIHHEGYQYGYETANGIHVQETGYIKNKGDKEHETLIQQGQVTYQDEHGNPITLTYIADENGFQPQGDHLPTPPPIPAVAKILATDVHSQSIAQEDYSALQFPHTHYALA